MAKRLRSKIQIENQRHEIADRYLKGETQYNIGQSLGLTQQMVSYDLAIIHRRWVQANQDDIAKRKLEELAKVNHLEVIYWRAWESSLEEKEITEQIRAEGQKGYTKASLKKEPSVGNPAFLAGVQWCIEQRCKILGHYAPTKLIMTMEEKKRIVIEEIIIGLGPAQQEALRRLLGGGED